MKANSWDVWEAVSLDNYDSSTVSVDGTPTNLGLEISTKHDRWRNDMLQGIQDLETIKSLLSTSSMAGISEDGKSAIIRSMHISDTTHWSSNLLNLDGWTTVSIEDLMSMSRTRIFNYTEREIVGSNNGSSGCISLMLDVVNETLSLMSEVLISGGKLDIPKDLTSLAPSNSRLDIPKDESEWDHNLYLLISLLHPSFSQHERMRLLVGDPIYSASHMLSMSRKMSGVDGRVITRNRLAGTKISILDILRVDKSIKTMLPNPDMVCTLDHTCRLDDPIDILTVISKCININLIMRGKYLGKPNPSIIY